jgi:hypothetical protein
MSLLSKLIASLHGENSKKGKKKEPSFHRQQLAEMKRWNQPLLSGWKA